jgi:hypothetical protein
LQIFHIPGGEIPIEWATQRGSLGAEGETEEITAKLRANAVEIAPGVHVALMSTGTSILPDGKAHWGATVAVWRHAVH